MVSIFLIALIPIFMSIFLLCIAYVYIDLISRVWRNIRTHLLFRVYSANTIHNREAEFLNDKILQVSIIKRLIGSLMNVLLLLALIYILVGVMS